MKEVWLRPNQRALGMSLLGLTGMGAGTIWAMLQICGAIENMAFKIMVGVALTLLAVFPAALALWLMRRPLLAYQSGEMLVYLRQTTPVRVPIEIVEGFLLGKQEVEFRKGRRLEVSALAIRLAEKATDWAKVEILTFYGRWCGGYINIVGTRTEPLSLELVNRLNHRLAEVQKENAAAAVSS